MSSMRIVLKDKQWGPKFRTAQKRNYARVQAALGQTAKEASLEIKARGDVDIATAGNFGPRWLDGFHSTVLLSGLDYTIKTFSDIFYFGVFEFGATIHGKPLLWIPLSFASDAQGVSARDYPGGLFRVDRKSGGAPLLLAIKSGEPKYSGHESVTIPQKFHIRDICKDVARKIKTSYRSNFRHGR